MSEIMKDRPTNRPTDATDRPGNRVKAAYLNDVLTNTTRLVGMMPRKYFKIYDDKFDLKSLIPDVIELIHVTISFPEINKTLNILRKNLITFDS